jgi:hypothetical protein
MSFITTDDFKTHVYAELIDEITRGDADIPLRGISAGISEAKGYLSRFDLPKIFGTSEIEPEVNDEYLKDIVKDLALWKMVKLANPNIDLKLIRTSYEDAIAWLKTVQKGGADPEGWPYKPDDLATPGNENYGIQWSSNKKRRQHF